MLSPLPVADVEFDIEEELKDDERAHAVPVCREHVFNWHPPHGTIIQAICGKLVRFRGALNRHHKKCERCASFQGKTFKCYVCGKELYG